MSTNYKLSDILSYKNIWFIIILIGLIIKIILLPIKTGDYVVFIEPWINFIKSHGFASSLKYKFYDYSPSYIYMLIGIAKANLNPLYSVKIVSILFEYIAAFFIGKIAYQKYQSNLIIWISLAVVPLLPTVILNSSYLSQCDSIYVSFILGSMYFYMKDKLFLSIVFLGIAFAFKMQTVFILPFYFVLMLKGKLPWHYFFLIPIIFIVSILPTWYFGRNFTDLIRVYIAQTDRYRLLTMNFPNLYIWINNNYYETVKTVGILVTFLTTLISGFYLSRIKIEFSLEILVKLVFLSAIIIPFILPGMHERYMYLGDVSGVLYFLVVRKNIHLPVGILLVSLYSYIRCSRFNGILPLEPAFVVYLSVIVLTIFDFIKSIKNESNPIKQ
jgi:Gpi18-like mannosyltransferase